MSNKEKKSPELRFKGFSDDWEQRKLGELAEIVRGASPRPIKDKKWFDQSSDIGWLRISDVTEQKGKIHFLSQKLSKEGQSKTRVLNSQHLLLSIAASVGKPVINYVKTGVHDGFLIFLNPKFNINFVFEWLEYFRPKWQRYGQPGSQVNLNSDIVRTQTLKLPSIEEQNRISEFLIILNDYINLHQRKINILKIIKQQYLSLMFPKITENTPVLRFKNFNMSWEWQKWRDKVDVSTNMVNPKTGEYNHLPHVGPGNLESFTGRVLDNVKNVGEENLISGKFFFNPGDIIYSKINPHLGKYALVDFEGLASADAYVLNAKNG